MLSAQSPNVVTHRSTSWTGICLTLLRRRQAVLSWAYGRTWFDENFFKYNNTNRHFHGVLERKADPESNVLEQRTNIFMSLEERRIQKVTSRNEA